MSREVKKITKVIKNSHSVHAEQTNSKDYSQEIVEYEKPTVETLNNGTRDVLEITDVKKSKEHNIKEKLAILITISGLVMAGTGVAKTIVASASKPKTKVSSTSYSDMYKYMQEEREKENERLNGIILFLSSIIPLGFGATLNRQNHSSLSRSSSDDDDYVLNVAVNHMNGTPTNPLVHSDFATNLAMSEFMKKTQENNGGLMK